MPSCPSWRNAGAIGCQSRPDSRGSIARSRPRSKQIPLGVIDLSDTTVETAKVVVARTQRALPFVAAEQLVIAPDCGMKYWRRKSRSGRCGRWSKAP
jgi:methionine synthase II (cobalamin-independent)